MRYSCLLGKCNGGTLITEEDVINYLNLFEKTSANAASGSKQGLESMFQLGNELQSLITEASRLGLDVKLKPKVVDQLVNFIGHYQMIQTFGPAVTYQILEAKLKDLSDNKEVQEMLKKREDEKEKEK